MSLTPCSRCHRNLTWREIDYNLSFEGRHDSKDFLCQKCGTDDFEKKLNEIEKRKAGTQEDADGVPTPTDEDAPPVDCDEPSGPFVHPVVPPPPPHFCKLHHKELKSRSKGVWDHRAKGRLVEGDKFIFDDAGDWYWCQGNGWHLSTRQ